MIIDIKCEDDTVQIARIVHEGQDEYGVNFLDRVHSGVYDFSQGVETINKHSVSGFYDVDDLEKTGLYVRTPRGYELIDDSEDEDFTCSDVESEESEDESLVDENEDEDDT